MLASLEEHRAEAEDPKWEYENEWFANWRTYVDEEIRAIWDTIPIEARLVIVSCCKNAADAEHARCCTCS